MERLTTHENLQELLGAYALDAVEPDEAAAIERHLPSCPRCRNELADHREMAALLGYAGGAAPDGVWDRIIASLEEPPPALRFTRTPEIGTTRFPATPAEPATFGSPGARPPWSPVDAGAADGGDPSASGADMFELGSIAGRLGPRTPPPIHARGTGQSGPGRPDTVVPIGRKRARRTVPMRFMVALATAAAVIVAALGVEVGRLDVHKSQAAVNLPALAFRVADADPHARHLTLSSPDGLHTIKAVIIADGTTYLGPGNLTTLSADETYQMWGVVDGTRISLGPVGDNPTYAAFPTPAVATVLAMTVETRGGVVTSSKVPVVAGVVPDA